MKFSHILALTLSLLAGSTFASDSCSPLDLDRAQLADVQEAGFVSISDARIPAFLSSVTPCLASTDPFFRDDIAYGGTAALLRRNEVLTDDIVAGLQAFKFQLASLLGEESPDPDGVIKPFAIILLAEVARTDRIDPWMSASQRPDLVALAARYLKGVEDYRAFEDGVGFRHGVAHAADLILQLALNQQIEADDLVPLLDAIAAKISPPNGVPYTAGEPGRLGRAFFYLLQRAGDSKDLQKGIQALVADLSNPAPYSGWGEVFTSSAGLTFRHNRRAFVEALYVMVSPYAEHELLLPYMPSIQAAVEQVP